MKYAKRLWLIATVIPYFAFVFLVFALIGEFDKGPISPKKLLAELFGG